MTPQGSLSGSNSKPVPFQQTRTIDWAHLDNSSINASLHVLAGISKANIDGLTIVVGRAIGGLFEWKDIGRERFDQALHSCKGMAGYKNVLWFGFGIEHITHVWTSTDQGAFCAALCACLTECYSVSYIAGVMIEMTQAAGAPEKLSPSLQQWRELVDSCAGLVANSTFGNSCRALHEA